MGPSPACALVTVGTARSATLPSDIRSRLSAAGRGNFVLTVAALVASFIVQAMLGRLFGPVGLGEYSATSLFLSVVTTLGFSGMPVAISQRLARREESGDPLAGETVEAAFSIALGFGAVSAVGAGLLWVPFANLAKLSHATWPALIAVSVPALILQYFVVNVLIARLRMGTAALLILTQPVAVGVGVASSYFGLFIDASTLAALGGVCTGLAAVGYLILRRIVPRPHVGETRELIARVLPGSAVLYITLLTNWTDRLLVAILIGPASLGAFAAASYFTEGILRLPRATGTFSIAAYARLADDLIGVQRILESHVRILAAFFLVSGSILIASARSVVTLVFGGGFAPATTTLQLLSMALLPMGISFALASSDVGTGAPRMTVRVTALIVLLQLVLGFIGISLFSIAGMALAELAVWLVALVVFVIECQRRRATVAARAVARVMGVAAPVFSLAMIVSRMPLFVAFQVALVGTVALGAIAIFILEEPERRLLRRLVFPAGRAGLSP